MGLVESLNKVQRHNNIGCAIGRIFLQLDKEEKAALQYALDSKMSRRDVLYALRSNGFTLGTESIAKHKQKRCGCKF